LVQLANSHFSVPRREKTETEAAMTKCVRTPYEATKKKLVGSRKATKM
jgi:hypothetical protein